MRFTNIIKNHASIGAAKGEFVQSASFLEREFTIKNRANYANAQRKIEKWMKRKGGALHFDFDLVVADSALANAETVRQTLREFRLEPHPKTRGRFIHICNGLTPEKILLTLVPQLFGQREKLSDMLLVMSEKAVKNIHLIEKTPMADIAQDIKNSGVTTTIMTNRGKKTINPAVDHLGIRKYFDFIFYVSSILKAKPEPDMFLAGQEWTKVPLSQSLFIDDNIECIRAARGLGMETVHIKWSAAMGRA